MIGKDGIWPDLAKVTALTEMPACKDVHNVRRFLGLVNQLGRFLPNLASLSQPLRDLLVKRNSWCWTESHQTAFDRIKAELSSQPVLALYSPNYETVVSADASSYFLGAVLTQRQPVTSLFRPVVYLSRSLTDTERRYSQIEKEALATTWACEPLSNYLIGLPFTVETDHKPLVPLLGTKALDELPPRALRLRLRLMRYQFNIIINKHGSASYIVREVLSVRERERYRERERERGGRERERERERDESDVTIVALKLAMNLHFPLQKNRTIGDELTLSLAKNSHFSFLPSHFRLSLHGEVTIVAISFSISNSFWF